MKKKNIVRFIIGIFVTTLILCFSLFVLILLSPILILGYKLFSIILFILTISITLLFIFTFIYFMFREEPKIKETKHTNSFSIDKGKEIK